jgi:hypothetical protein
MFTREPEDAMERTTQSATPAELREAARFLEETSLDALDGYSDIDFAPVIGDLQNFPRPSPEARTAQRGFDVLREGIDDAVAALHALAAALESGRDVPPALIAVVQPYLEVFRTAPAVEVSERERRERYDGERADDRPRSGSKKPGTRQPRRKKPGGGPG